MKKQWASIGNDFTPCGETQTGLRPGFYRPMMAGGMNPHLVITPVNLLTDNLLVLGDSPVEHVVNGIKTFWTKRSQYERNGLIHKRGYLMEGPPGTGKTSISNLIAQFFVENKGIVFFAGVHNISDGSVSMAIEELRGIQDNPLLVVVEEFDQIMQKNHWKDQMMQLMDGSNQVNNVVYLVSTNFIEKIDARFTKRPSRVDEIIHVGEPSEAARREYLKIMLDKYEGASDDLDKWVTDTSGLLISHLKEAVVAVKILEQPLESTLSRLRSMVPEKTAKKTNNPWAVAAAMESLSQAAYHMAENSGEAEEE